MRWAAAVVEASEEEMEEREQEAERSGRREVKKDWRERRDSRA